MKQKTAVMIGLISIIFGVTLTGCNTPAGFDGTKTRPPNISSENSHNDFLVNTPTSELFTLPTRDITPSKTIEFTCTPSITSTTTPLPTPTFTSTPDFKILLQRNYRLFKEAKIASLVNSTATSVFTKGNKTSEKIDPTTYDWMQISKTMVITPSKDVVMSVQNVAKSRESDLLFMTAFHFFPFNDGIEQGYLPDYIFSKSNYVQLNGKIVYSPFNGALPILDFSNKETVQLIADYMVRRTLEIGGKAITIIPETRENGHPITQKSYGAIGVTDQQALERMLSFYSELAKSAHEKGLLVIASIRKNDIFFAEQLLSKTDGELNLAYGPDTLDQFNVVAAKAVREGKIIGAMVTLPYTISGADKKVTALTPGIFLPYQQFEGATSDKGMWIAPSCGLVASDGNVSVLNHPQCSSDFVSIYKVIHPDQ